MELVGRSIDIPGQLQELPLRFVRGRETDEIGSAGGAVGDFGFDRARDQLAVGGGACELSLVDDYFAPEEDRFGPAVGVPALPYRVVFQVEDRRGSESWSKEGSMMQMSASEPGAITPFAG